MYEYWLEAYKVAQEQDRHPHTLRRITMSHFNNIREAEDRLEEWNIYFKPKSRLSRTCPFFVQNLSDTYLIQVTDTCLTQVTDMCAVPQLEFSWVDQPCTRTDV